MLHKKPIYFFHKMKKGEVQHQGYIFEINDIGGGRAILFDWVIGAESEEMNFTPKYFKKCKLYNSDMEMRNALK